MSPAGKHDEENSIFGFDFMRTSRERGLLSALRRGNKGVWQDEGFLPGLGETLHSDPVLKCAVLFNIQLKTSFSLQETSFGSAVLTFCVPRVVGVEAHKQLH